MADNIIIKDGNNVSRTLHTIEDSTSVHFNQSIPTDSAGNTAVVVSGGQAVAGTMGALVVAQRDALPAGTNLIGAVSISLNGLNVPVSIANSLTIAQTDSISTNNSSTLTLGGGGVFTGTADDALSIRSIVVNVYSNVASATDGLSLQWSSDGTNWDLTEVFTISAGVGFSINATKRARYFRVVYTNGGSAQASFRLQTILNTNDIAPRKTRLSEAPSLEEPGIITHSVIAGENSSAGGSLVNVKVSPSGTLQVGGTIGLDAGTNLIGGVSVRGISDVSVSPNGLNIPVSIANTNNINTNIAGAIVSNTNTATITPTNGSLYTTGFTYGFDGTTWRRLDVGVDGKANVCVANTNNIAVSVAGIGIGPVADGQGDLNGLFVHNQGAVYNPISSTWDRVTGTSLGTYIQANSSTGATFLGRMLPTGGSDGTNNRVFKTHTDGALVVHVSNSQTTQLVSVGGAVSTQGLQVVGTDGAGDARTFLTDTGGRLVISSVAHLVGVSISPNGLNIPVSIAPPAYNLPVSVHPVTQSGTWNIGAVTSINSRVAVSVENVNNIAVSIGAGANLIGAVSISPNGLNIPVSIAPPAYNLPVSVHPVTQSGTWTVQPGNTANTSPWIFSEVPTSTDGLTVSSIVVSAFTSGYLTKGAAGKVYSIQGFNNAATPLYLRVYNKATAPAAADTPYIRFIIPGNTAGAGFVYSVPTGIAFGTGISWRISGGVGETDATAPADNQGFVNIFYK